MIQKEMTQTLEKDLAIIVFTHTHNLFPLKSSLILVLTSFFLGAAFLGLVARVAFFLASTLSLNKFLIRTCKIHAQIVIGVIFFGRYCTSMHLKKSEWEKDWKR